MSFLLLVQIPGVDYLEGAPIPKTPGEQDNALGNNETRNSNKT